MNKAIFLDKDGTLIRDVPYNTNPDRINLQAHAVAGLRKLQDAGYLLVVITNQDGVARGYFPESALEGVVQRIDHLLHIHDLYLNGFYYCPHHPEGRLPAYKKICQCRKPAPGLLFHAAEELRIDLSRSWMIGDILDDVEAGNRAGCRTVLIDNGNETLWDLSDARVPDLLAPDLNHAAELLQIADNLLAPVPRLIPADLI